MKKLIFVLAVSSLSVLATRTIAQVKDTTRHDSTSNKTTSNTPAATSGDVVNAIGQTGYSSSFAAALKTSGLESTLQGAGPYTVFAPADKAFGSGEADSLLKDPAKLKAIVSNEVVTGKYTKADIIKALTAGKGTATLTTLGGSKLTLKINANKNLELSDSKGNTALVTVFDAQGTNGVVHVIDHVLVDRSK